MAKHLPGHDSCLSFTLIELLTVIAIIAVLAAILLPSLSRARERGRSLLCVSNCKSITSLYIIYASDNNDYPPIGEYVRPQSPAYWQDTFAAENGASKYTYDNRNSVSLRETIWYCPSHPEDRYKSSNLKTSYGYNYWGITLGYTTMRKNTFFKRPSSTFWVAENFSHRETNPCGGLPGVFYQDFDLINQNLVAHRHLRKATYSFFDGHASSLALHQTPNVCHYPGTGSDILRNTWFVSGAPTSTPTFNNF